MIFVKCCLIIESIDQAAGGVFCSVQGYRLGGSVVVLVLSFHRVDLEIGAELMRHCLWGFCQQGLSAMHVLFMLSLLCHTPTQSFTVM